jgi:uncharacterized protein (DUF433 family)
MANTTAPTAEDRLHLLEERLARLESKLISIPGTSDLVSSAEAAPGGVFVFISSTSADLPLVRKALSAFLLQETQTEKETPVDPWKHLVARKHPWRKQLFIKGRKMTVRQLVGGIKANQLTDEQAAANYHLPVEAIREALAYFEANPEVIALDAAHERYLEKLRGRGRGPESVPG